MYILSFPLVGNPSEKIGTGDFIENGFIKKSTSISSVASLADLRQRRKTFKKDSGQAGMTVCGKLRRIFRLFSIVILTSPLPHRE
jgi:hypothetical protein